MSRLTQIIQNTFIRISAFISLFFKSIGNFFQKIFGFFGNLFGLSQPDYFLESDDAQTTKRSEAKPLTETKQNTTKVSSESTRRSSNKQMDYYLKMADEIRKK
jgi:hypothetical protein